MAEAQLVKELTLEVKESRLTNEILNLASAFFEALPPRINTPHLRRLNYVLEMHQPGCRCRL